MQFLKACCHALCFLAARLLLCIGSCLIIKHLAPSIRFLTTFSVARDLSMYLSICFVAGTCRGSCFPEPLFVCLGSRWAS